MPRILVLGDLMLDCYIWGSCSRISPEAPVPVVLKQKESARLGGCANVISNLLALGADVGVMSVLGDDEIGRKILSMLKERGAKDELILFERGRKTSQKSRIMVAHQQVLRLDSESVKDILLDDELINNFSRILENYDIVLLSDYAKGVLTPKLTSAVIKLTKAVNKMVLVDPKGSDYGKYKGATLLTPNRKEAKEALNMDISSDNDILEASKKLKNNFDLDYGLITLSEQGIALFDGDEYFRFSALAKEVFDVTGAGDSVLATLGYCLGQGDNIKKAIETANLAAAVVVGKVGSADASWDEIHALSHTNTGKIKTADEMENIINKMRKNDAKIVFTNGCFDILHLGHISYLRKAKELGDVLIIGLNSDSSVKRLKGEQRPINCEFDRAKMLEALEFVDFVVIFDEDTPSALIEKLRPDILVKGADYKGKSVAGSEFVKELVLIDFVDGKSTSKMIEKIKNS